MVLNELKTPGATPFEKRPAHPQQPMAFGPASLISAQQHRQLRDVGGDAPRLVARTSGSVASPLSPMLCDERRGVTLSSPRQSPLFLLNKSQFSTIDATEAGENMARAFGEK
jgi:hypothetical protein